MTPQCGAGSRESLARFERLVEEWGDRVKPLVGDLTQPDLGDHRRDVGASSATSTTWCTAPRSNDITVDEDTQRAANVDGTRAVIDLANARRDVAPRVVDRGGGQLPRRVTETNIDVAQDLRPRIPDQFEAEMLVRSAPGLRMRIYRPAVVAATRAPARWTRSTAVTTSSLPREAGAPAEVSPRSCLPTPAHQPRPVDS